MVIRMYKMWGKQKLPGFPLSSQEIGHYDHLKKKSSWYNRIGCLGIKHHVTYLLLFHIPRL